VSYLDAALHHGSLEFLLVVVALLVALVMNQTVAGSGIARPPYAKPQDAGELASDLPPELIGRAQIEPLLLAPRPSGGTRDRRAHRRLIRLADGLARPTATDQEIAMSIQTAPDLVRAPDAPPPPARRRVSHVLSGALGGLAVAAAGAALIATGVIDGRTTREVVPSLPATLTAKSGGALDAEQIYAKDGPGVAYVRSFGITTTTPFGQARGSGTGSGILLDKRGDVLTNAHVVDGATRVTVRFGGAGSAMTARVVGKDNSNDLAVIRVDPRQVRVHPLPLGDSSAVGVGDAVAAIGNPFGLDRTITSGIVSALQRQITGPSGFTIDHVIQTDAAINPGNSGGPLIDAQGRVIGINSQIATGGSGDANVGIGFAIPINTAKAELLTLERGGTVAHAFLGVVTAPGRGGALVQSVAAGSAAADAGLRGGDLIVAIDGVRVGGPQALAHAVAAHRPGQAVSLRYLRQGKPHTARVTLGARPS
jgi:S1-C subfamily serine protease